MTVNRYYSSTAVQTSLSNPITPAATSMTVGDVTGFPVSYPYTLILELGTDSEEIVEVTAAAGTTLTVTRGVDSTTPLAHSIGATVVHGVSARDHREAQEHIAATAAVHGLQAGSDVVGTADAQTLVNKTLTAPTINDPTVGNGTFTDPTLATPTITTPAVTGGTWTNGSLNQPIIADFTNAQHDHASDAHGGTVPQTSVSGLDTRLTSIEATDTTQTSDISSLDTRVTALETGVWTAYTPVWHSSGTAPSIGNGILTGAYVQVGKIVFFRAYLELGSTSNPGSGVYWIGLPVAANTAANAYQAIAGWLQDSSAGSHKTAVTQVVQPNGIGRIAYDGSSSGVSNVLPFTWANGDAICISGVYEAA